mmetsp:Transcript_124695/g.248944  ORF Transcript_124695/g.248944 Transcript_124695/m.248944 type:complete len:344 (-) Transcript_124695:118-1149(-)
MEEEFRKWRDGSCSDGRPPPPVEALRCSEDGALILAFSRGNGSRVATVALSQVEGSSFFADGLEDPPEAVEDWLTDANSYFTERPRLTLGEAVSNMLSRAPRALGLSGVDAAAGDMEEDEEEDDEIELEEDDDMAIVDVEAGEDRAKQRATYSEEQKWDSMVSASANQGSRQASQVLMREMRRLLELQGDGSAKPLEIEMVSDNLYHWCVKMHADGFPDECVLKGELKRFGASHDSKLAAVVMDVCFPDSYPMAPPFIRVVRPRFQQRTGHITLGGSVCMQMLTPSGWLPSYSLENVFVSIRSEMIAGGGRIDFANCRNDYTMAEAKEAFKRVAEQYGWTRTR